ncbi:MAG: hypothetical protein KDB74_03800 [Flavobacteriales bacterium]|nr:hypothetical protein [Flavobacteriales bacterium]
MKSLNKLTFGFIALFLIACGSSETKSTAETENENTENQNSESAIDLTDMEKTDLSEFDFPIEIYIPSNNGKPEITATEWGSLEIRIGDNFGVEIVPNGSDITSRKADMDKDLVFTYNFIEESPDLIVYEQTILDSGVEPEFHFFMNKTINGELFEIKSLAEMNFKKHHIEKMLNAAKSIQVKSVS